MFEPVCTAGSDRPLGGVLVGGRSRRFGSDKATARLAGIPLVERAVRTLQEASEPVVLLGGDGSLARGLRVPWCPDRHADSGPLAGVAAGLHLASELGRHGLIVLACDLPLVTGALLRQIVAAADAEVDAVVARSDVEGDVQPLCAWYAPAALEAAERLLSTSRRSMFGLLSVLRVRYLSPGADLEDGASLLLNVNTPSDLSLAARRVRRRGEGEQKDVPPATGACP